MNWLIIILAIVLVVILWYVYTIMNSTPSVASNIDLSTTTLSIKGSQIKGSTSPTYAIGAWIYVKNLPGTSMDIFQYVIDGGYTGIVGTSSPKGLFALNLGASTPTLVANVATGSGSNKMNKSITITQNLPIQTWVYVVVSVSSTYIDAYMNGKLVVSTPITGGPFVPSTYPSNTDAGPTFVSGSGCPVIITGLSRWNTPLDPQTVWSYYSQGNGNAMQKMLGSEYHLDVVFQKDSTAHELSIF